MKRETKKGTYVCGQCRQVFVDYEFMVIHQCPYCRSLDTKPLWRQRLSIIWSLTWPLVLMYLLWYFFMR